MNENDRTVDLEDLEELSPGIDDLSLFNAKDSNGNHRFNAPIPFGMAPELEFIIEDFLPVRYPRDGRCNGWKWEDDVPHAIGLLRGIG